MATKFPLVLLLALLSAGCGTSAPSTSSSTPTMIIADIRFSIRPDAEPAFTEAIGPFLAASREAEGNLAFDLLRMEGEAHRYTLIERWESMADFEAYLGSDAFAAFRTEVGPLLAGPPESAYYEARVADRETVR